VTTEAPAARGRATPESGDPDPLKPDDAADPAHPVGPVDPADPVAAVAGNVVLLMRSFTRARARLLAAAQRNVEWSAHLLLSCIAAHEGPMRASELAGCLQSDPSTVSRQVAALVRDGYLERNADPDDRRASLLVITDAARHLLAEHEHRRIEFFAGVLQGWDDADRTEFARLIGRFTQAYERAVATTWPHERTAPAPAEQGSTSA
jgi:DNA-binding MarR family transcriptional regulator